jgi:hypothetical protein
MPSSAAWQFHTFRSLIAPNPPPRSFLGAGLPLSPITGRMWSGRKVTPQESRRFISGESHIFEKGNSEARKPARGLESGDVFPQTPTPL